MQATSFQRIIDSYDRIYDLLRVCLESGKHDLNAKTRIKSCYHKLKRFNFLDLINLSKTLQ